MLPVQSGSKNPGSVVGKGWPEQSTRDAVQIRKWWGENPGYGIALHISRSGAIAFDLDVDELASLPTEFQQWLGTASIQLGRQKPSDRGHYVFALRAGETYGNGAGAFAPFGDVRCKGVIIAQPTPHMKAGSEGARYDWQQSGHLPLLPDALRAVLRDAPDHEAKPYTSAELDAFLDAHTGATRLAALDGVVRLFENHVSDGRSRHESARDVLCWAFRESVAGLYPARAAFDRLDAAFEAAFRVSPGSEGGLNRGRGRPAPGEFRRTAEWAAAQAMLADPAETLERVNRDPANVEVDEEAFRSARPLLSELRVYAQSVLVSPWAMFGAVLARSIATIPPRVLPPTVGSAASLNTFVALVGPSGLGKGTAESAAEDFLRTETQLHKAPAGSGEGFVKLFGYRTKPSEPQFNIRDTVLMSVDEVDGFTAQASRTEGTFLATLKTAWSGGELGFSYADATKAITVKKHRYRLALVMGVQPGRADFLFADGDGGTPQRFVWLPTSDPNAPEVEPASPDSRNLASWPRRVGLGDNAHTFESVSAPLLDVEVESADLELLPIPDSVADEIRARRREALRKGGNDGLDGHAVLARLKVAAGLMWLGGRTDKVSEEDWELAGIVMAVSNRTRAQIKQALIVKASHSNQARGRAEGEREAAKAEAVEGSRLKRVIDNVRKHLKSKGRMPLNQVKKSVAQRDRELVEEELQRLVEVGDVSATDIEYKGRKGKEFRWVEGR